MRQFSLEHAILAALAYADLFDFPLTAEEIWRYLFFPAQQDVSFFDVLAALEHHPEVREYTAADGGFYFLKGRHEIVTVRLDRYAIAERKYKCAKMIARALASMPFVRMVCVCNTLGWSNARDESDIDFFIVGARAHLWTVRLLCAVLMQLAGVRPQKQQGKDAICLSFFASEDVLDLSRVFLRARDGMPDVYFLYWIPYCVPIYDSGGVYDRFWEANTGAVLSALPCATPYDINERRRVRISGARLAIKKFLEACIRLCGNAAERAAQRMQMHMLPKKLKDILNTDTRVVMSDSMMKFHSNDRREEIRERFIEKLKELGVMEME